LKKLKENLVLARVSIEEDPVTEKIKLETKNHERY